MTRPRARLGAAARAALLVGLAVSFVAAVDLVRWVRPGLLADPEPSWAPERLLLGLAILTAAAAAGSLAAAGFRLWSAMPRASAPLDPIPFGKGALAALALASILGGTTLRFWALSRVPSSLWVDDLSLIAPALELKAAPGDFSDSIRATPEGVARPYGTVGVLYLEGYRAALKLFGTTVFGVRFPSAIAGAASLVTALLLGRSLLPQGGGALAALALAGMRWQLILSRWAWNMVVLAPLADLAALALVEARRRRSLVLAGIAGLCAGVGAHVYLSAWVVACALAIFALWPGARPEGARERIARAAAVAAGFALAAAPLFLLRQGREAPYFARAADHNVVLEIARSKSILPPVAAAADGLACPWFLSDPSARHDLPGRRRLGWLLGVPVAIALGRVLLRPRDELSGLLASHATAALAAVVAGGQADNPNGSRFGYLVGITAVAASAGVLWLVGLAPRPERRAAAIAAVGMLAIGGALGAREALSRWSAHRATFDGFHGQDTLVGRAAARWDRFGELSIALGVGDSPIAIGAVRRYGLDPDAAADPRPARVQGLRLRIVRPGAAPAAGERPVEIVRDGWGRQWAVVLARRGS